MNGALRAGFMGPLASRPHPRMRKIPVFWRKRHKQISANLPDWGSNMIPLVENMPHAFNASPDHPAVDYLVRLHADLGGKILENRKEAERLASEMKAVESVIKIFNPDYNVTRIAARRRYKGNGIFKRGTILRNALDVLRKAFRGRLRRERLPSAC
jgi:hypothetical protein